MAKRRIKFVRLGRHCSVAIHKDSEWGEFVVSTVGGHPFNGRKRAPATYHTDDKQDARNTAAAQVRWLRKTGLC